MRYWVLDVVKFGDNDDDDNDDDDDKDDGDGDNDDDVGSFCPGDSC